MHIEDIEAHVSGSEGNVKSLLAEPTQATKLMWQVSSCPPRCQCLNVGSHAENVVLLNSTAFPVPCRSQEWRHAC